MTRLQKKLDPNSTLGQALYDLVEAAHESDEVTRETLGQVAEIRNIVEHHPSGDSLQDVLAQDLDELEEIPAVHHHVKRLRAVLPGKRHVPLVRPADRKPIGRLIPLEKVDDGYVPFACSRCGSQEFRFEDPTQGEIGETFALRRRPGLSEAMWRFGAAGGVFSRMGVQGRVACSKCGRVFEAESGVAHQRARH